MTRMQLGDIHPYEEPADVLARWGDVGGDVCDSTRTPQEYYLKLLQHMAAGGAFDPLEVAFSIKMADRRVYVFNGHHRLAIARLLGWTDIEVQPCATSDDAEYVEWVFDGAQVRDLCAEGICTNHQDCARERVAARRAAARKALAL